MIWLRYDYSKQVLSHVGAKGHHFLCFKQYYRFINTTCMVDLCLEPRAHFASESCSLPLRHCTSFFKWTDLCLRKYFGPRGCLPLSLGYIHVYDHNIEPSSSLKPLGASLGRENESLYKWSRSHDQDGRHGYVYQKRLKIFFRTRRPTK